MPGRRIDDWLESIGLPQYAEIFARHEIDVDVLRDLTEADLEKLGIPLGSRKRLLRAIEVLASQAVAAIPTSSQAGAGASEAERRQLTVLFCDLVGSTELSQRLDPEEYRNLVRAYQTACAEVITRYEGHIAQYLGDGLLVYFGYPQAHEEDAQRAVRAALNIVQAVARVESANATLAVRIGIHTGLVVVGDVGSGTSLEQLALGDTPNIAARLQGIAVPNNVVLSDATRQLCVGAFEYTDLGSHALKGIGEPVRAWQAMRESKAESRFEAQRGSANVSLLVGRDEELQLLFRRWQLSADAEGQVVLLSGEPGIGKSRLVRELRQQIASAPHARLHYQCSPFHTHSALFPIIEQLERAAGFANEHSASIKLDLTEALLREMGADLPQTAPLFADLLSLPLDRYPPLDLSPQKRKEKTLEAWIASIAHLAKERPVLIVFEDVHWIDPTTREALDLLIKKIETMRTMVFVTFRPEFTPEWSGLNHVTSLSLNRLGRKQVAALVEKVTGGRGLPAEVLNGIINKTDGVPLFVEELTKAIVETGVVKEQGDRYGLTRPLTGLSVPATLQDSLMARLDRLAPVKEVAQVGACIGREFAHELLAIVSPVRATALDEALATLAESGLVSRHGTPPEATYVFKHVLVRDAAYESLLRSRRAQLHAAIAQALETHFPVQANSAPEMLAHHFGEAGLTEKAVTYWLAAGQRSLTKMALLEAISHLTTALNANAALEPSEHRDRRELDIRMSLGTAYFALLGWVAIEVYQALEPARAIAQRLGEHSKLVTILYYIWFHKGMRGQYAESLAIAEQISDTARRTGDSSSLVTGLMTDACAHSWTGDYVRARQLGNELVAAYRFERDSKLTAPYNHDPKCLTLVWGGVSLWALGWPDQARQACLEQLSHARRVGHAFNLMWGLSGGAMGLLLRRETRLIWEWLRELRAVGREQAMPIADLLGNWWGGYADIVDEEYERGYAQLTTGSHLWEGIGALHLVPYAYLNRALALSAMDRSLEAIGLIDSALQIIDNTNHRMHEAEVYRTKARILLRATPAEITAPEVCLLKSLEVARSQSAKGWELRAATSLAALWRDHGKRQQAREVLQPVYAWFTEGLDTKDLIEAKALLEELRG